MNNGDVYIPDENYFDKDARISELESALVSLMGGTSWQTIQQVTGIPTDKIKRIDDMVKAIKHPGM